MRGTEAEDGDARRQEAPTVSIVTAVYNAERFLAETLESVAAQTFPAWEHILVDDHSTDDGAALADAFARRDPRIRVLRQGENTGAVQARNRGIEAARGRYIAFLDADDLWLPDKLERQLRFMQETDAAVSHTGYRRMSVDGTRLGGVILPPARLDYKDLLKNTAIAMSTGMVDTARLDCLTVHSTGHRTLRSDLRFWLQALAGGAVANGLRADLARYRVVPGSVSSSWLRSAYWVWRAYRGDQKLNALDAAWCFAHYAGRAGWKRLRSRSSGGAP
jgi:teichuronic acid biosynthesis glycosyltransferase TuaG